MHNVYIYRVYKCVYISTYIFNVLEINAYFVCEIVDNGSHFNRYNLIT